MEKCDQKLAAVQVANEVGGTKEVAQRKSNQDGVLILTESQPKLI